MDKLISYTYRGVSGAIIQIDTVGQSINEMSVMDMYVKH